MNSISRRDAASVLLSSTVVATAGCTGFWSSTDAPRSERADERVTGRWGAHHRTPGNTRRTDATGPRSKPAKAWESAVGSRPFVDPLVADSLVYEYAPERSETHAIEVAAGERTTAPAIDGLAEFVLAIGDGTVCLTGADDDGGTSIVGRDVETGDRLWRVSVPGAPSSQASLVDGVLYVSGFYGKWVRAFDVADGTERWAYETIGRVGPLAVAGDVAAFTTGPYLFSLDGTSGERRWHHEYEQAFTTDAVAAGDVVVAGTDTGRVLATGRGGDLVWETTLDAGSVTAITASDDRVFVGTDRGIGVLSVASGDLLAETERSTSITGLSMGSQRLHAASLAPSLTAFEPATLDPTWSADLPLPVIGGPTILDGHVLVRLDSLGTATERGDGQLLACFSES
jgi:outer membrane protein assembly factor BamB